MAYEEGVIDGAKAQLAKVMPLINNLKEQLSAQIEIVIDQYDRADKTESEVKALTAENERLKANIAVAVECLDTELGGFADVERPYVPEQLANIRSAYDVLNEVK